MISIKDLKTKYGGDKKFLDSQATIKKYRETVPKEKWRECTSYEELYEEAKKYVSKQNFEVLTEDMDDYFYELSKDEGTIAVLLGVLAYAAACEVDRNGKNIEAAIDKVLPDGYDRNNPFDVKEGYGHRVFGHDPATFGMKNIPGDMLIKTNIDGKRMPIRIGEYLGTGTDNNVSVLDLIWKFYGNNNDKVAGVWSCVKHSIVHFSKDICTPSGLPLPFITAFNKYEYFENLKASSLQYKHSLMSRCDKNGMQLKASDFVSLLMIETLLELYCKFKKLGEKEKSFKSDMKLIAMGTCLCCHLSSMILGNEMEIKKRGPKKYIPGRKINVLMTGTFAKIALKEMVSVSREHRIVVNEYKYMEV